MATKSINRKTRYAVIPVKQLRTINALEDEEVIAAGAYVNKDMIEALEEMVNAAKAGKLKGESVLALGAAAWKAT